MLTNKYGNTTNQIKIYTASKVKHADKWKKLRDEGWGINATWIDRGVVDPEDYPSLWVDCIGEATEADICLAYIEPGERLKGALVEIGCTLSAGGRVYLVCNQWDDSYGTWNHHPRVHMFTSLQEALDAIKRDYTGFKEVFTP